MTGYLRLREGKSPGSKNFHDESILPSAVTCYDSLKRRNVKGYLRTSVIQLHTSPTRYNPTCERTRVYARRRKGSSVSWLRRFVARISRRRPGFDARPVHVVCSGRSDSQDRYFVPVLRLLLVSIVPRTLMLLYPSLLPYKLKNCYF